MTRIYLETVSEIEERRKDIMPTRRQLLPRSLYVSGLLFGEMTPEQMEALIRCLARRKDYLRHLGQQDQVNDIIELPYKNRDWEKFTLDQRARFLREFKVHVFEIRICDDSLDHTYMTQYAQLLECNRVVYDQKEDTSRLPTNVLNMRGPPVWSFIELSINYLGLALQLVEEPSLNRRLESVVINVRELPYEFDMDPSFSHFIRNTTIRNILLSFELDTGEEEEEIDFLRATLASSAVVKAAQENCNIDQFEIQATVFNALSVASQTYRLAIT